jgi:hypothetical protein
MLKEKALNNQSFKSVVKAKDMDEEMFREIERLARETIENPKEKFRDEMVKINYLINRKLQII